jgi:hypothetical protein
MTFGWPLLINGILLFLIMQGDRFIIGAADKLFARETYSKALLGFYSAAFVLSAAIIEGIGSILSPVMLPLLSRVQDIQDQFQKRCLFCIRIVASMYARWGFFYPYGGMVDGIGLRRPIPHGGIFNCLTGSDAKYSTVSFGFRNHCPFQR